MSVGESGVWCVLAVGLEAASFNERTKGPSACVRLRLRIVPGDRLAVRSDDGPIEAQGVDERTSIRRRYVAATAGTRNQGERPVAFDREPTPRRAPYSSLA